MLTSNYTSSLKKIFGFIEKIPPWACFLAAFLIRFIFALKLGNGFYQIDETGYHQAALNLMKFNVFGSQTNASAGSPIPAFYFSIFFRLFGDRPLYARLGLLIPDMALVWTVWQMTEKLTRSKLAGKIALLISTVYPFFIYYGGMMLSETPYLVFMTFGIWRLCQMMSEGKASFLNAAATGISLGLAALSRPEGAVIMVGIWLIAIFASLRSRPILLSLLWSSFFWALLLISWSLRNRIETGSFSLDSHGGISLLHGTLLFDLNEQDTQVAMHYLKGTPLFAQASRLSAHDQDNLYWRAAIRFMLTHPEAVIHQWLLKSLNFWRFYPRMNKVYFQNPANHPSIGLRRGTLITISFFFEPWLIIGGLWGTWQLFNKERRIFYPIVLFIAMTFGVHMVSVSQMRYRLPIMPFLILGFSYLLSLHFQSENR